jgi:hypothetical protein
MEELTAQLIKGNGKLPGVDQLRPSESENTSRLSDRLADFVSEPFRIEIIQVAGIPLPVAVPSKGWMGMGAIVAIVDIINGNRGNWSIDFSSGNLVARITLQFGQAISQAPGVNQNLSITIDLPFFMSRMLLTTNSAVEAYLKITLLGVLWPIVLVVDIIPPIIEAIVFAVAIGALTPVMLIGAIGNLLSVIVTNLFRFIMNFVVTIICLLFNRGNVCENCGCQNFQ